MKRLELVAIRTEGRLTIHFPHTTGNYATLCGMDGDDPSAEVDQAEVEIPKNAKVNCKDCIAIFDLTHEYDRSAITKRKAQE